MTRLEEQEQRAVRRLNIARMRKMTSLVEGLAPDIADRDEDDWTSLMGSDKKPYSEADLTTMVDSARKLQYTPAGRNILQAGQDFIVGKNAQFNADDEDEKVQEYWDGWAEFNDWDMRVKEIVRRVWRDGEVFLRWFRPKGMGGYESVRFVDPKEIRASNNGKPTYGIKTDSDDIETVEYYYRVWMKGNVQQNEKIPADEITHIKILVDSDVKRGVSFFVGIAKYMKEYEQWIKDRIELNRIRHIWNVVGNITGGSAPSAIKSQFDDVTGKTPPSGTAKKKVPKPGSVLLTKGVEWDLKSLNINARDTKDDGRAIQLMIALGTNIPEYIVRGDASNANYASTMVSESPFVKCMEFWQDFFEKPFKGIFKRVIEAGIAAGPVPAKSKITGVDYDRETGNEKPTVEKIDTLTTCTINFATLIHRNLKEDTEAYVMQNNTGIISLRTIREKLGLDNEEELDQLDKEARENEEKAKRLDQAMGGGSEHPPNDEEE